MSILFKGIDVQRWQGIIDFDAIKNAKEVEFAIVKLGGSDNGVYIDSKFQRNYDGFKQIGVPVGAYWFVGPLCKSYEDGVADANRVINAIRGKQFEYPVYIDFESPDNSNKEGNTDACIGFCTTMEKAGYFTGIYGSDVQGFQERLDLDKLTKYALWVARYGVEPQVVKEYGMWQYQSTLTTPGISGNVDHNYCYVDYPSIIKSGGFNGYNKNTNESDSVLKDINIKSMSNGDLNTFIEMANKLGLKYTVS